MTNGGLHLVGPVVGHRALGHEAEIAHREGGQARRDLLEIGILHAEPACCISCSGYRCGRTAHDGIRVRTIGK